MLRIILTSLSYHPEKQCKIILFFISLLQGKRRCTQPLLGQLVRFMEMRIGAFKTSRMLHTHIKRKFPFMSNSDNEKNHGTGTSMSQFST